MGSPRGKEGGVMEWVISAAVALGVVTILARRRSREAERKRHGRRPDAEWWI